MENLESNLISIMEEYGDAGLIRTYNTMLPNEDKLIA